MIARQLKPSGHHIKWKVKTKPYGGKRQALTQDELDRLFAALKGNRHGHRDYMVALVTFLHGLRICAHAPALASLRVGWLGVGCAYSGGVASRVSFSNNRIRRRIPA